MHAGQDSSIFESISCSHKEYVDALRTENHTLPNHMYRTETQIKSKSRTLWKTSSKEQCALNPLERGILQAVCPKRIARLLDRFKLCIICILNGSITRIHRQSFPIIEHRFFLFLRRT